MVDNRPIVGTTEPNGSLTYIAAQQMLAIYRAVQDARGAIRSIIKMQMDGSFLLKGKYQIDENKIFVGGVSAGSLLALTAVFFGDGSTGQGKINMVFPGVSTAFGGTSGLGPIDPIGVYYADPNDISVGDFHTRVQGVLNCWGALFVPNSAVSKPYNFFKGQGFTLPHVISFCGAKDPVFWYTSQGIYFSPSTADVHGYILNTESRCLPHTYTTPSDDMVPPTKYETCIASQTIYNMEKNPGTGNTPVVTEFYMDCDMYHGLDNDCDCDPIQKNKDPMTHMCTASCSYLSNFGVAANTDEAKTYDYIAARAATFFQTVLGGTTKLANISTSRFVECENKRVTCDGTTDSGCSDLTGCTHN